MPVTKVAHSGPFAGTVSVFTTMPAGILPGDVAVCWIATEGAPVYATPSDTVNSPWGVAIIQNTTSGLRFGGFARELNGTESGQVDSWDCDNSSNSIASIVIYRSTSGKIIQGSRGSLLDTTSGTGFSGTTGSLTSVANGMMAYGVALNNTSTRTARNLTQTGATLGTLTAYFGSGTNITMEAGDRPVTVGATAACTLTYTLGTASVGVGGVFMLADGPVQTTMAALLPQFSLDQVGTARLSAAAVATLAGMTAANAEISYARASQVLAMPAMVAAGVGRTVNYLTASSTMPAMTAAMTGQVPAVSAALVGTLPTLAASATAIGRLSAGAVATLAAFSAQLSGAGRTGASAVGTLPAISTQLSGVMRLPGTMTATLPAVTSSLGGVVKNQGSLNLALAPVVASGEVGGRVGATLATSLPTLSAASLGALRNAIAMPASLPAIITDAGATARASAALASNLAAMNLAMYAGAPPATGEIGLSLPPMGSDLQAAGRLSGDFSGSLPALNSSTTGGGLASADLTLELPAVEVTGSVDLVGDAEVLAGLPTIVGQVDGQMSTGSVLEVSLLPVAASATGSVEIPDTPVGAVEATMPAIQSTSTGHSRAEGGLTGVVPTAVAGLSGHAESSGAVGAILGSPSTSAEGSGKLRAEVALSLPTPSAAIEAEAIEEGTTEGALALTIPLPSIAFEATATQAPTEATLTVTLPAMQALISEKRPAYSIVAWLEDDLLMGVEPVGIRAVVEEVDHDSVIDERWHSYIEADWLEATT